MTAESRHKPASRHVSASVQPLMNGEPRDRDEILMRYLERQDQQTEAIAAAMHRLADVAEKAVQDSRPAMQFFGDASRRLDALCHWLQKWGPWMLGLAPVAASVVGIVTPNAAARLDAFLKLIH